MRIVTDQRIVLGPPGCGKTTRMLSLLDEELTRGLGATDIAYISFTRKAVHEARDRAAAKFKFARDDMKYFKTVHSLAFSEIGLTRREVIGLPQYKEIGEALGIEFSGGFVDESTGMVTGGSEGDAHLFMDSLARARCITLEEQWQQAARDGVDWFLLERTVEAVRRYKETHGLSDFTDMLERYCEHGAALPVRVAFIDEAQDLSQLQWRVLRRALASAERVYIAGDDDQAIYRWSGADVGTFLSLEGSQQVLDRSWRCPSAVHALADRIAKRIEKRIVKRWAPNKEGGSVSSVHSIDGIDPSIFAAEKTTLMLARNTYLLKDYERFLRSHGVPYLSPHGSLSIKAAEARAIYAWTKLTKGHEINGREVHAIYDCLRGGVGIARGYKSNAEFNPDASYSDAELRSTFGLLARGPWYDALDAIAERDRFYYRSCLRNKFNLLARPTVQVNTIHGVKGGEADTVVIRADMSQRTYREFAEAGDDEHRVAYVAASRSRDNVVLVQPRTTNHYPYDRSS